MDTRKRGAGAELQARCWLERQGWQHLASNYYARHGEVDLVMLDGICVVAVEVKARRHLLAGHPAEAVTPAKLRRVALAMQQWRCEHDEQRPWRIDVIAITGSQIEHFTNVTA